MPYKTTRIADPNPDTAEPPLPPGAPMEQVRAAFARRVYRAMLARGWNQSELARQAGLARDAVSNYVRGKFLPEPASLQKLAEALGTKPDLLLPKVVEMGVDREAPAFEMKQISSNNAQVWLRVNRAVSFSTAAKIAELLQQDTTATLSG